jgi:hypothetical protein
MLFRHHAMTREEWHTLLKNQHNRCQICNKVFTTQFDIIVDHSHATNKIRGLLCRKCNIGLGMFLDDPVILLTASNYLKGR